MTRSAVAASILLAVTAARAERPDPEHPLPSSFSVMAGLAQWILWRGGNVAVEYKVGRLAFEVSHGQGLDLNQAGGLGLSSGERAAGVTVRVPWTTGGGAGVRITEDLHVLVEAKVHRFEVSAGGPASRAAYETFTLGPGVFYTLHLYKGLFVQPNVRYWPTIASTLSGGNVDLHRADGSTFRHSAHAFNLFANVNLGWAF